MKKNYSINWENGEIVSVEIDGVRYDDPDQIPDPEDRAAILRLMSRPADEDFDENFDENFDQGFDKAFGKEFDEKFRELERQTAHLPKVIIGIFLLIALLTLGIAAVSTVSTVLALSRERSTPGQVVDLVGRRDSRGYLIYYPVVQFDLPDLGRQTVQLSIGSSSPAYAEGQTVTVLYDPERFSSARIMSVETTILRWILPVITGVVGVAFLAAALFAGWFLRAGSIPRQD